MSISITVRNGTAIGKESLCRTCRYASILLGYSESEEEIRCGYFSALPRLVPFPVSRCSDYLNKLAPTLYELEKIAFIIDVKDVKATSRVGFAGAVVTASTCEEDSE
ncbi:MAG TPA: hypothetical protein VKH40_13790 [Alloacidobacterium sp.]|nr:hypothetical protein [Alloacidobacterium sp.]